MMPHPSLGGIAFRLEAVAQAVLALGRDWLSLTGAGEGVLLGLATWAEMPDGKLERREDFLTMTEQEIPSDRFAPPPDYRKVAFSPDCYPQP
jgi:hypothetical protein